MQLGISGTEDPSLRLVVVRQCQRPALPVRHDAAGAQYDRHDREPRGGSGGAACVEHGWSKGTLLVRIDVVEGATLERASTTSEPLAVSVAGAGDAADEGSSDKPKRSRGGRNRNDNRDDNRSGQKSGNGGGKRRGLLGRGRRGGKNNKPQENNVEKPTAEAAEKPKPSQQSKPEAKSKPPKKGGKGDAFEGNMPDFLK